ncbi:MAG: DEAD/DEAH box helicase [Promethearchaeota archaeon]
MTEHVTHPLVKPGTIERRAYQENLLVQCLLENCLVVLPTGLGKTVLAALLTVAKLNDQSGRKVAFLAPTKPLAAQHQRVFREVLNLDPDFLNLFTGATPPEKRTKLWRDTVVGFATPQVFQNDVVARRVDLSEFALLIFDEAHRAVGDYPYTYLAKKYLQEVPDGQVLAITASPGGNLEKIRRVAANLGVTRVEVRTETDPDVRPYVHGIQVNWKVVTLPQEFLSLRRLVTDQLRETYVPLKRAGFLNSSDPNSVTRMDLLEAQKAIQKKIGEAGPGGADPELYSGIKLVSNAIRVSHAAELVETQGVGSLLKYLEKLESEASAPGSSASLKGLVGSAFFSTLKARASALARKGVTHPKVGHLVRVVREQLVEKPDSRVMVFAQFRDSVKEITRQLRREGNRRVQMTLDGNPTFQVKPARFVGQRTAGRDKGLTQKEQLETLERFRSGEFNVLVATSVAEEGLDVAECDLVVFYDVVPSEIRTIQRRGRTGRRRTGRVVVLIAKDTRDEGYYWAAKAKERKMAAALDQLKRELASPLPPGHPVQGDATGPAAAKDATGSTDPQGESDGGKDRVPRGPRGSAAQPSPERGEYALTFTCRPERPTVVADSRETSSPVVRKLDLLGATLELRTLPVADYVVGPDVGVERKSAADFAASVKDGRLFDELSSLRKAFRSPVLLLEGDPLSVPGLSPAAALGALAAVTVRFHVPTLRTRDPEETAAYLYALAKHCQKKEKKDVPIRLGHKVRDLDSVLEEMLVRVPGINVTRAKRLLRRFRSLPDLFAAEEDEIKEVAGVGSKLAKYLRKVAGHRYGE